MIGFYARFIPRFSQLAAVLHGLKKKGACFVWAEEHAAAFDSLKQALCQAPVLQIPDFDKEFILATDASDIAISAVLQQRIDGGLAPISYHSRTLSSLERKYSTYEKECLAVIFGCEKCRPYLEHKEFQLQCDNLALCWLLKRVKEVGRLGRWILRLSHFKFKVRHTRGTENVVADALSRMFDGESSENPEVLCAAMLDSLPLVYSSLLEHQNSDAFCQALRRKIDGDEPGGGNFCVHKVALCYLPNRARRRRSVVPPSLKMMLLRYYHDGVFAGHLGAQKTFFKVASNFWWPGMRGDVFKFVQGCELCQRAKPAQNAREGLHSAEPSAQPLDRVFIDFVGRLVRSKRGNIAILVAVDAFSKFVALYPVRRIASRVVLDCLEREYFPAFGTPKSIVSDNARVFCGKVFKDLCFRWG